METHPTVPALSAQDRIYEEAGIYRSVEPSESYDARHPAAFTRETRRAYQFATEDTGAYFNAVDLKGKRIACVAGSGDVPINAWLYGAADVDAVDVSPVACLYSELKLAGVRRLDYGEFLGFFATRDWRLFGDESFSYPVYEKLRPDLSETARDFFDHLMTPAGRHPFLKPGAVLIAHTDKLWKVKRFNPYLQGGFRFGEAKARLKPTRLHSQGMIEFFTARPAAYDTVHLSNAHNYGRIDHAALIAAVLSSLRAGGRIVMIDYSNEPLLDVNGCPEFTSDTWRFNLRTRVVVVPNPLTGGSMKASILEAPSPAAAAEPT